MENDPTDSALLHRFVREGDGRAFATLVERHIALVYSVASRMVGGDRQLAEDAAQMVFTDLARKAPALVGRPVLAGWLYTSTHHAAANLVRSERRRQRREQEAHMMHELDHEGSADETWTQVRPVLDDALQALSAADRDAVLLRFFQARGFEEIAARIGVTESGARMRVERAVEKLRRHLQRRGVSSTAAALASVLGTHAVGAAPATLASTITASALAAGAVGTGGAFTLLNLVAMTKTKLGLAAATALTGAAIVGVPQIEQSRLRDLLAAPYLTQQELDDARASRQRTQVAAPDAPPSYANAGIDADELSRMRNDAAVLRALVQEGRARLAHADVATPVPASLSGGFHDLKDLDVKPRVLQPASPKYPYELRRAGIPGTVTLQLLIDADGKVAAADPIDATHAAFVEAAVDAVKAWKFEPGQKDGRKTATRTRLPIVFTLNDPNWY